MLCAGMGLTRRAAADEGAPAAAGQGLTRVYGTTRPFFAVVGGGFAALTTLGLEHDFASGLALGLEVAPLALVFDGDAMGAVTHARAHVGFANEFIAVGAGVGAHVQHYGASGLSLASTLRLGTLDGFHLALENTYTMTRSFYSGRVETALDGMAGELALPLVRRFTMLLEGGFATDLWAYATIGGETFIRGAGEPGSLKIRAGFGLAAVVDNFRCLYGDRTVCENRTAAVGPTISVGLEARY
jgi:hypothetical protein